MEDKRSPLSSDEDRWLEQLLSGTDLTPSGEEPTVELDLEKIIQDTLHEDPAGVQAQPMDATRPIGGELTSLANEAAEDEAPPSQIAPLDLSASDPAGKDLGDDELDLEKIIRDTLRGDPAGSAPAEPAVSMDATQVVPSAGDTPDLPQPQAQTPPAEFRDDEFRDTFGEGEVLERIFSDQPVEEPEQTEKGPSQEEAPEEETEEETMEKGRPKRRSGSGLLGLPHLAATVVWLLIIVAVGAAIGRMVWLCAADVLAFGREAKTVTITIEEGDTLDDVAQKLKDAELISYPGLFKLYANISDAMDKIKPGTYVLNDQSGDAAEEMVVYDYMALVSAMSPYSSGLTVVEDLRIPEGYTCAQIFKLLEENGVCTAAELEEYAASGELDEYWFLEGVERGDKYCLEGYLFPNTYDFYENDDPERVLEKMLDAFDASFTDVMKQKLQTLQEEKGYTIREVVIIASMIEKESASDLESYTVSSVIYNRLADPSEYPYLNIDATIVYALGGKADLTEEDLKVDSPYNTYTNKGLPPGPISSPSQNSLAAALGPEDTDYYYYAFDPSTGAHHFSRTYEEHMAFLATLKEDE